MITETTSTDTRRQRAIEITGIARKTAVTVQNDALRNDGILVDLHITRRTRFLRAPNWFKIGFAKFPGGNRADHLRAAINILNQARVDLNRLQPVAMENIAQSQRIIIYAFQRVGEIFRWAQNRGQYDVPEE